MRLRSVGCTLLALATGVQQAACQSYVGPQDPRIETALTLDVPTNGVSTTPEGRLFLVLARVDGSKGPAVVEYNQKTKTMTPYPNSEWNSYAEGKNPANHFVRINSQRIGPDGHLYVVDVGSPAFGQPVILPNGPKIVQVDVKKNAVSRIFTLGNVTRTMSLIDDIRFNPATGKAYITDAGSPGLIVLDMESGISRRVLEADMSTQGVSPVSAEGAIIYAAPGTELQYIHADQLEVSPDGKYFYYQPSNGGRLSRIETKYMDKAFYNTSLSGGNGLSGYSTPFALTPSTGGTAIDAKGNIYLSDTDSQRIITISRNGSKTLLVQDPRLLWVDAMWVSGTKLWMPAAQLNRGTPFGSGKSNITKPLHVFTIDIGVGPSPIDHA